MHTRCGVLFICARVYQSLRTDERITPHFFCEPHPSGEKDDMSTEPIRIKGISLSDKPSQIVEQFVAKGCHIINEDKSKGIIEMEGLSFLSIDGFSVVLYVCPLSLFLYKVELISPSVPFERVEDQARYIYDIYKEKYEIDGIGQANQYLGYRNEEMGIDDSWETTTETYHFKEIDGLSIVIESICYGVSEEKENTINYEDVCKNHITYCYESRADQYNKEVSRYYIEMGLKDI